MRRIWCLGVFFDLAAAALDVVAPDLQELTVEVHMPPTQGKHLATAHPSGHHQPDQRAPHLVLLPCRSDQDGRLIWSGRVRLRWWHLGSSGRLSDVDAGPVPSDGGFKGSAEDGVQHEHRGGRQRPAFMRPALDLSAVVLTGPAMLEERSSVAASAAAAQLSVETLDPLRSELGQRHVTEREADEPVDESGVVVPGIRTELRTGKPFIQQRPEANPGPARLLLIDLTEKLGAELLRLLRTLAGTAQPQPRAGNGVDTG
jgi:hypothetical protein